MSTTSHERRASPLAAKAIAAQIAPCVYWPPFSRTPGTYPLMYPGFGPLPLNGGSSSLTMRCCGLTSRAASESSAFFARSRGAMPESTDQLCAIESIWHSTPVAVPSGVPSSK